VSNSIFSKMNCLKTLTNYSTLNLESIFNSRAQLRQLTDWWLYLLASSIVMLQVFLNEVPGDVRVFYEAGLNVKKGVSPWKESLDPVNAQFLNGPIYSFFCFLFTFLDLREMYWLISFLTIALLPTTVSLMKSIFGLPYSTKVQSGISSLIMLSFPFRANLEYGQFVVPYVFLLVLLLYINRSIKPSVNSEFAMGFGLIILADFKPHLFFVWFLILFHPRRKALSLGVFLGLIIEFLCLCITAKQFFPIDWFSRMFFRASASDGLSGYYNLHTLIRLYSVSSRLSIILVVAINLALLIYCLNSAKSNLVVVLLAYLAMFPIFHPQDFFFLFLLVFILHAQKSQSIILFLCLGLSLVWSESGVAVLIYSLITIAIYHEIFSNRFSARSILEVIFMISPSWLMVLANKFPDVLISFRLTANVLSILGFLVLTSINPTSQKIRSLF